MPAHARKPGWLALVACLLLALPACLPPKPFDEKAWQKEQATADPALFHAPHRQPDGAFYNPWRPQDHSAGDLLYWFASRNILADAQAADPPVPVQPNDGAYLQDAGQPPSLTWVGHATFVVQWGGQVVVTDPFFGQRALVVARRAPPAFGPQALPDGTVVLISHNHYDHLDQESVAALGERAVFLVPLGLGEMVRGLGAKRVTELDWWQAVEIGGTRFTFLPAQHWSRRWGQGYNESLWGAFMLERDGLRVFYGADSGYFPGYREIAKHFGPIEVALLPVGAYEPRWFMHYAHMDIPEAVEAARDLQPRFLVPTQWGVLKLGDEPASYPVVELKEIAERDPWLAARLCILPVGGRLFLDR
ncbi:MAG: MBL fold metallo-hydrolase [Deltaproteobacteria bacterium]|nr:MBL fold metallo-hydrolase [Deltaproteobacteria bacterium]